jgi:hypothetical protein
VKPTLIRLLVFVAAAVPLAASQIKPAYSVVSTVPFVVDGQPLRTFVFDPVSNRFFAGSDRGLFWIDLNEPKPRLKGPLVKHDIIKIEVAPDVGRLFYLTPEELWSLDLRKMGEPVLLGAGRAYDLAYEPTRKEMYVTPRLPVVWVFSAETGERAPDIKLPGWLGRGLEAVPGRVFLDVDGQPDLYLIDAKTREVSPWKVKGPFVPPGYLDADPTGRYLFARYDRFVVAIDIEKAAVIDQLAMLSTPSIAYDPGAERLIVTWQDPVKSDISIVVYRVDEKGFAEERRLGNPQLGRSGVEPTSHGFVQQAQYAMYVWAMKKQP